MQKLNLPENVLDILRASKAEGTWKQYESALGKWSYFCSQKGFSIWDVNISNYLLFLTELYAKGLSYSVLNSTRSALSSVFGSVDGSPIGEHKLIVDFMRGVSRLRPARPRYDCTWNPDIVLSYLKTCNAVNLRNVTLKLVALLALCTGQRVQTISCIMIRAILWSDTVQIRITSNLKTTTITRSNPVLIIPPYHDKDICPVETLRIYKNMTEGIRGNETKLFISLTKPHKAVTSQTISRWLCNILELSGINVNKFHAHSFRHASVSKAASRDVNIDTILRRVGWTPSSKTFALFYKRPFEDKNEFGHAVLAM